MIISENHTRNKFYISSIDSLSNLIKKAGYEVKVALLIDEDNNDLKLKISSYESE